MNNEEFYEYVKVALTTRLLALRRLPLEVCHMVDQYEATYQGNSIDHT